MTNDEWYRNRQIGLLIVTAVILLISGLFYLKYLLAQMDFTLYKFIVINCYLFGSILSFVGLAKLGSDKIKLGLIYLCVGIALLFGPYFYFNVLTDYGRMFGPTLERPANSKTDINTPVRYRET